MKKIIGIFIVMLLIGTLITSVSGRITDLNNVKSNNDITYKKLQSGNTDLKFMVAGNGLRCIRFYQVHVPPDYDGSEPVPLVLLLHGSSSMGRYFNPFYIISHYSDTFFENYTKFSKKADEEGFIVVYPKSLVSYALDYSQYFFTFIPTTYPQDWFRNSHLVDDTGFIDDLIDKIQRDYNIDSNRIYMTGMSNGADTVYCYGSLFSDRIAAIAPVAGETVKKNPEDEEYTYPPDPENPVSVIVFHGTQDSMYPWNGDSWGCGVDPSIQFFVEHNGCNEEPEIFESDSGNIVRYTYSNGNEGSEVVLYKVVNGTHCWPGNDYDSMPGAPWLVDTIQEIDATDLIWDFFVTHPKQ